MMRNLFFDPDDRDAIMRERCVQDEYSQQVVQYYAVLKRRLWGRMTAEYFLLYTRRFTTLCQSVYGDMGMTLRAYRTDTMETVVLGATPWQVSWVDYDVSQLDEPTFQEIFEQSSSVALTIKPVQTELSHCATVTWMRSYPTELRFRAQGGEVYDDRGKFVRQGLLTSLLFAHMFCDSWFEKSYPSTLFLTVYYPGTYPLFKKK
ncbi:MAG: hypothetical protein ACSLEX_01490 [Minisyncoccota bacterium]